MYAVYTTIQSFTSYCTHTISSFPLTHIDTGVDSYPSASVLSLLSISVYRFVLLVRAAARALSIYTPLTPENRLSRHRNPHENPAPPGQDRSSVTRQNERPPIRSSFTRLTTVPRPDKHSADRLPTDSTPIDDAFGTFLSGIERTSLVQRRWRVDGTHLEEIQWATGVELTGGHGQLRSRRYEIFSAVEVHQATAQALRQAARETTLPTPHELAATCLVCNRLLPVLTFGLVGLNSREEMRTAFFLPPT
ncbi:hypothetical protein K470DRAFT_295690 [Piedraia hortae CBS 480.64]|uniref:Uncharacterized protein n=1 Tax=Piedraia hortae CBS 480.64 TaxID=1314780 RepID=A0A6A7BW15_9PEZI|nr:hypothetical protein K470DRAFT_295690 [Piedraia hortae CBS 480.64]